MKRRFFLSLISVLSLIYGTNALATCGISFYVDKSAANPIVFSVLSVDGKEQYTLSPTFPGLSSGVSFIPCTAYNIYAQPINSNAKKVNPYGDYAYIANPVQLTGAISVFFPSRFQPISVIKK